MKSCQRCKIIKPLSEFHKDKSKPDGYVHSCKPCTKEYRHAYYLANSGWLKKYSSDFGKANPGFQRESGRRWRSENRERYLELRRARHKERYASDKKYVCQGMVRRMLQRVFKLVEKPDDFVTFEKIGYTCEKLMQRLSVNFKPGMSWDNFGEWEIDHKIPIAMMIARGETRPEVINCLANLQPLWKSDNRSKGARYVG